MKLEKANCVDHHSGVELITGSHTRDLSQHKDIRVSYLNGMVNKFSEPLHF